MNVRGLGTCFVLFTVLCRTLCCKREVSYAHLSTARRKGSRVVPNKYRRRDNIVKYTDIKIFSNQMRAFGLHERSMVGHIVHSTSVNIASLSFHAESSEHQTKAE